MRRAPLLRALCLLPLLCLLIAPSASAAEAETVLRDAIPESAEELLSGVDLSGNPFDGIARIARNALDAAGGEGVAGTLRQMLMAALLCGAAAAVAESVTSPLLRRVTETAGGLCVFLLAAGKSGGLLSGAERAIRELTSFSEVFTAVFAAASSAAGAPTAASAQSSATVFLSALLSELAGRLLLPLCGVIALLALAGKCMGQEGLCQLSALLRGAVVTALRTLLVLYSAFLTISGALGAATDGLLRRGLKTGVSGAVPIVGGALGEACDAILAGAAAVRNTVGVTGLLILLSIACLPLLRIALWYAALRAGAALCAVLSPGGASAAAEISAAALGLLFAITATVTAVQLISVFAGLLALF